MLMNKLTLEQVRLLRLHSQRLHPEAALSISGTAQLVREVCGLQAQELTSATLAVRPRSHNLTAGDVKRAREVERSILLTWCMRGTLHLVAADDLSWLLPLFGPIFIRKSQRRYAQLGLDRETRLKAANEIQNELDKRGPLTRPELAQTLDRKGIPVAGQAIAHLVRYAALEGIICYGPERDGQLSFVLLEDWVGLEERLESQDAQTELARCYLQAYAPATPEDLASWSGISMRQARAAFQTLSKELVQVEIAGSAAWMLESATAWMDEPPGEPSVRLLPRYDAYLLGYRSRAFMVSDTFARRIHPGGGIIKSTVIVDGRAVGIWRSERKKNKTTIVIEPFESLSAKIKSALEAEVQDLGRFTQQETSLRVGRSL
jgi:hypothetical protein